MVPVPSMACWAWPVAAASCQVPGGSSPGPGLLLAGAVGSILAAEGVVLHAVALDGLLGVAGGGGVLVDGARGLGGVDVADELP